MPATKPLGTCPNTQRCVTCDHPMAAHWTFSTGCGAEGCGCARWTCPIGGHQ